MTQKWPSVQVTHSANEGLIGIALFPFGAAFLPALPRGDGVVFSSLRPHLLRPSKVLRRRDDALDGLCDGLDEERRNAHLPLPLAGLVPGPSPPRYGFTLGRQPQTPEEIEGKKRYIADRSREAAIRNREIDFMLHGKERARKAAAKKRKATIARKKREAAALAAREAKKTARAAKQAQREAERKARKEARLAARKAKQEAIDEAAAEKAERKALLEQAYTVLAYKVRAWENKKEKMRKSLALPKMKRDFTPEQRETWNTYLREGRAELENWLVERMRKAKAKVNSRTGLHVHVGAQGMTPTQIKNLVKIFYKQETLILKATGTQQCRIDSYTRKTDLGFVDKICKMANPTMAKLADAYYAGYSDRHSHYSRARYHALNLHNLWNGNKGTVEFRYHEQSLHAGVIKAAVLIDLLMVLKAKSAKAASAKNPRPYSEASAKYDFRVFLFRLGANGATFKSMRKHLCKNLPGSAAWKDGRHD